SGAIDLDERALATRAEIVDGPGKDFLAGSGFSQEENGSARGSGKLHLGESAFQRTAIADDLFKIKFAADFFFKVELFLGQLVFQSVDFLECQGVFDGDGDLRADLPKQLDVLWGESIVAAAGQIERAEGAAVGDEGNAADRLDAVASQRGDDFARVAFEFCPAREERQTGGDGVARGRCVARHGDFPLDHSGADGEIECMNFQQAGVGIEKRQAGVIVMNDTLECGNDTSKNFRDLAADHQNVVDLQENAQAVALAGELRLVGLRILEIERV